MSRRFLRALLWIGAISTVALAAANAHAQREASESSVNGYHDGLAAIDLRGAGDELGVVIGDRPQHDLLDP